MLGREQDWEQSQPAAPQAHQGGKWSYYHTAPSSQALGGTQVKLLLILGG